MQTPIYIIASPRPRVGKTMLARLLTEYLHARHRDVIAFDLSGNEPSLLDYLPRLTETASVADTFDQMKLMDRLIVNDGVPKVLDIGANTFNQFFKVFEEIEFLKEAAHQHVAPMVLFLLDKDYASGRAYDMLEQQFPANALIPVNNEQVLYGELPRWLGRARTLDLPVLPEFLRSYITKLNFSFAAFAANRANASSELYDWIRGIFLHFRELDLSLMLRQDGR